MVEDTKKMNVGDSLKLIGKTKHGRNRVREQGAAWKVMEVCTAQRHSAHPEGTPLALLVSACAKHWRWVKQANDVNFDIIEGKNDIS